MCRCQCDRHAAGLVPGQVEGGRGIAAQKTVNAFADFCEKKVGGSAAPSGDVNNAASPPIFSIEQGTARSTLSILAFGLVELVREIFAALFQCLQAQLPAMQLNGELIDVTGHLGPLRFVLFKLPARVREVAICVLGATCLG